MKLVGLTGGIGSGKSTILSIFRELGCYILSADDFSRQAVAVEGVVLKNIFQVFGNEYKTTDGGLDRRALGKIVFQDKKALKKLESILHPEIQRLFRKSINFIEQRDFRAIIIYEIPLLFEKKMESQVQKTILVVTDKLLRVERLMKDRRLSREEINARMATQLTDQEKCSRADFYIKNNYSLEKTREESLRVYQKIKKIPEWEKFF